MANNGGILTDGDGDLLIRNGGFVVGDSVNSEARRLLLGAPGAYWWIPNRGVNLRLKIEMSASPSERRWVLRDIRQEFQRDLIQVNKVEMDANGQLDIDIERP